MDMDRHSTKHVEFYELTKKNCNQPISSYRFREECNGMKKGNEIMKV